MLEEGVCHRGRQLLPLEEGCAQLVGQLGHAGPPQVPRWPCSGRGLCGPLPHPTPFTSAHSKSPLSEPGFTEPFLEDGTTQTLSKRRASHPGLAGSRLWLLTSQLSEPSQPRPLPFSCCLPTASALCSSLELLLTLALSPFLSSAFSSF